VQSNCNQFTSTRVSGFSGNSNDEYTNMNITSYRLK